MNPGCHTAERTWGVLNEDIMACRQCARLVTWREQVAREKRRAFREWEYWGRPVPGFGDRQGRILVVGLAPGAHGSNRTGRMFTGDASGDFLYAALHRAGFANQPFSNQRGDGLALKDIFITAVGRCVPPGNKPERAELDLCRPFLLEELSLLKGISGIVALGSIALHELLRIYLPEKKVDDFPFSHGAFFALQDDKPWLMASYHPSRQNTQTGRLTADMFDDIWRKCRKMLES